MNENASHPCTWCVVVLSVLLASCAGRPVADPLDVFGRSAFFASTATAPAGELEAQVAAAYDPDEALDASVALTYGVTERTEIGLSLVAYSERELSDGDVRGVGDLFLRLNSRRLDEDSGRPAVALMAAAKLPVGEENEALSSGETDVFLGATLGKTTPLAVLALVYELGLLGDSKANGTSVEHAFELIAGRNLNDRLALLVALAGTWRPEDSDGNATGRFVLAYSAAESTLLEAGVELGLDDDAPDSQLLLGLTLSF